jgi:hypothetical protein
MQTAGIIAIGIAIALNALSLGIRYFPTAAAATIKWLRRLERKRELDAASASGRTLARMWSNR